jgi:hypothetical protein
MTFSASTGFGRVILAIMLLGVAIMLLGVMWTIVGAEVSVATLAAMGFRRKFTLVRTRSPADRAVHFKLTHYRTPPPVGQDRRRCSISSSAPAR